MSAALALTLVTSMPSVSTNQETLHANAKQATLEMEVTAEVSTPSTFLDSPLTSMPIHSHASNLLPTVTGFEKNIFFSFFHFSFLSFFFLFPFLFLITVMSSVQGNIIPQIKLQFTVIN
jgi:VIT1/CCC1 family predicted Fe2+/Mn2+ transporter